MKLDTKVGVAIGFALWFFGRRGPAKQSEPLDTQEDLEVVADVPGLYYGKLVSSELQQAVMLLALELGVEANDLMTIFTIERGIKDGKLGSGVYHRYTDKDGVLHEGDFSFGLFGMSPATAFSLGTSPEELFTMSDVDQLAYVKKFFEQNGLAKGGKNDVTGLPLFGKHQPGELSQFDQIYSFVFGGLPMLKGKLSTVIIDKAKDPKKFQQWAELALKTKDKAFMERGTVTKKDVLIIARKFRRAGSKKAS